MSIFLNKDSKVIVQGITGGEGTKHAALMLKAGTQIADVPIEGALALNERLSEVKGRLSELERSR